MFRFTSPLIFILLLLFTSCQKSNMPASSAAAAPQPMSQQPQIIFVNLEITEDSLKQEKSIVLINSIVSNGKLKDRPVEVKADNPGDIQCTFLSASGQPLHTIAIPNPLERIYEVASEDGKLQKKTIKLNKATISLRAPLEPGTTQLLVQQIQDNHQLKDLHILNLSL